MFQEGGSDSAINTEVLKVDNREETAGFDYMEAIGDIYKIELNGG